MARNVTIQEDLLQALLDRVVRMDAGCWEYTGCIDSAGYGSMVARGISRRAHRLAWEIFVGPIPEGAKVLHRCDNPPCVNPAHLFLGSTSDNFRDCLSKGRHPKAKLTPSDVELFRDYAESGMRREDLCARFGLGAAQVYLILTGRSWAWLRDSTC